VVRRRLARLVKRAWAALRLTFAAVAFLNWMVAQERMASNLLAKVSKVDIRGRQAKRRAITPDELQELFKVTPPKRRLIYLAAIYTGLRLGELKAMVKLDLHLDDARPYVAARASTTKNRKEEAIPLHPALAAELREATKDHKDGQPVFQLSKRISRTFKADLLRAGIEPVDALGRKLDFHALRKTFGTRLAAKGVAQRLAQELMRHQDPKLTALNYTDETLLPTFASVASLDWEGEAPAPAAHTDNQHGALFADMALEDPSHVIQSIRALRKKFGPLIKGIQFDDELKSILQNINTYLRELMNHTSKNPMGVLAELPAMRNRIGQQLKALRDRYGCKVPPHLSVIIPN
jgi:site-specific recombinase XerC